MIETEFKQQLLSAFVQWQKGPRSGEVRKIQDIRLDNDGFEYFFFVDGTKELSVKFPDWFIPIDSLDQAPITVVNSEGASQISNTEISQQFEVSSQKENIININSSNPIFLLLNKQKKEKRKITLEVEIDLPKEDTLKILSSSFDNFDESFLQWLKDSEISNELLNSLKNNLLS